MNQKMTIKLGDKDTCLAMRWVMQCASNDEARPVLTGAYIANGKTVTADGFTLAIAPTPKEYEGYEGKIIRPVTDPDNAYTLKTKKIPVSPQLIEYIGISGTFPDYEQILPKDKPFFRYCIDPEFLGRLATMPTDNGVVMDFYGDTLPVKVSSMKDGNNYTAVIMPMQPSIANGMGLPAVKETQSFNDMERKIAKRDDTISRQIELIETQKANNALHLENIAQLEQELSELRGAVQVVEPEPTPEPEPINVGDLLAAEGLEVQELSVADLLAEDKVKALVERITTDKMEHCRRQDFDWEVHKNTMTAGYSVKRKYIYVDIGLNTHRHGAYMIEKDTERIYGIKGYGVIHRGYQFGTLDTVSEYYWGDFRAVKVDSVTKISKEDSKKS